MTAEAVVETRCLRLHVTKGSKPELFYGSSASMAPAYDLTAALGTGPASFTQAKLGPVIDTGREAPALPAVARGVAVEGTSWKTEQPIVLPTKGKVAYFDLDRGAGPLSDVRIIDRNGSQVPYVVETEPRRATVPLAFRAEAGAGTTRCTSTETSRKERGSTRSSSDLLSCVLRARRSSDRAALRYARQNRHAPDRQRAFRESSGPATESLPYCHRERHGPHVTIQVANGDNAPLVVASLSAEKSRRRVNFVFDSGDELRLLTGNDAANVPQYDLRWWQRKSSRLPPNRRGSDRPAPSSWKRTDAGVVLDLRLRGRADSPLGLGAHLDANARQTG